MEINVFIRFDEFTMFDFLGKKMMGFNEKRKILCWRKMMMKKKLRPLKKGRWRIIIATLTIEMQLVF